MQKNAGHVVAQQCALLTDIYINVYIMQCWLVPPLWVGGNGFFPRGLVCGGGLWWCIRCTVYGVYNVYSVPEAQTPPYQWGRRVTVNTGHDTIYDHTNVVPASPHTTWCGRPQDCPYTHSCSTSAPQPPHLHAFTFRSTWDTYTICSTYIPYMHNMNTIYTIDTIHHVT